MPQASEKWFGRAFFALVASIPVYLYGVVVSGMLTPVAADKLCQGVEDRVLDSADPIRGRLFPLSMKCMWEGGTSTEKVPPLVNPLIFGLLALSVALVVLGVRALRRQRREACTAG